MNKIVLNKILIVAIGVVCLAMFLVPQGYAYNPGKDSTTNASWDSSYITDDFLTMVIYTPFPVIWILFLLLKKSLGKRILKFLLLAISFLYLIFALEAALFTGQDFGPYYGALIPLLIFPLLVALFVNDRSLNKIGSGCENDSSITRGGVSV